MPEQHFVRLWVPAYLRRPTTSTYQRFPRRSAGRSPFRTIRYTCDQDIFKARAASGIVIIRPAMNSSSLTLSKRSIFLSRRQSGVTCE